jgi:TPR repeat protein
VVPPQPLKSPQTSQYPFLQEELLWVQRTESAESDIDFLARVMNLARDGELKAMASLGLVFEKQGDFVRAREWFTRAMTGGHAGAMERLAWMHGISCSPR